MKKPVKFRMGVFCLLVVFSCARDNGHGGLPVKADLINALERCRKRREQYAFEPGTGLRESVILEELGRLEESICAAFQDLEYQYSRAGLSRDEVLEALGIMMARVGDAESAKTVLGLEAYVLGEYAEASELLMPGQDAGTFEALRYYYLASTLRSGTYTREDLLEFAVLEPRFRNFGPYYDHLWKIMKAGGGVYTLDTAGPVLEKSVLLLQNPKQKAEALEELARLYAK